MTGPYGSSARDPSQPRNAGRYVPSDDRDPWERAHGEGSKVFLYFAHYRDAGTKRSLAKTAAASGISLARAEQLSQVWSWVARATAWDDHQDATKREAQIEEVIAMGRRHAQQSQATLTALTQPITELLGRMRNRPDEFKGSLEAMHVSQLLHYAENAARVMPGLVNVERLARGASTSKTEVTGPAGGPLLHITTEVDEGGLAGILDALGQAGVLPAGLVPEDLGEEPDAPTNGLHPPQADTEAGGVPSPQ